jgi:hypothetical protein
MRDGRGQPLYQGQVTADEGETTGEEKIVGIEPVRERKKPAPVPDRFKEFKHSFARP